MVGQVRAVVVGRCRFGFVGEPACALVFVEDRLSGDRHYCELGIVVDPGAGLVGLLESAYFVGIICISPSVAHFPVCGVQKFIPQGRATAGYVFPVESECFDWEPTSVLT